jgi:hypothetical protein
VNASNGPDFDSPLFSVLLLPSCWPLPHRLPLNTLLSPFGGSTDRRHRSTDSGEAATASILLLVLLVRFLLRWLLRRRLQRLSPANPKFALSQPVWTTTANRIALLVGIVKVLTVLFLYFYFCDPRAQKKGLRLLRRHDFLLSDLFFPF